MMLTTSGKGYIFFQEKGKTNSSRWTNVIQEKGQNQFIEMDKRDSRERGKTNSSRWTNVIQEKGQNQLNEMDKRDSTPQCDVEPSCDT